MWTFIDHWFDIWYLYYRSSLTSYIYEIIYLSLYINYIINIIIFYGICSFTLSYMVENSIFDFFSVGFIFLFFTRGFIFFYLMYVDMFFFHRTVLNLYCFFFQIIHTVCIYVFFSPFSGIYFLLYMRKVLHNLMIYGSTDSNISENWSYV